MKQRFFRAGIALLLALALLAGMLCLPGFADEPETLTVGNTRAELIYLIWWMKGCPEPTITENPYADVSETDDFYKAALWAREKGILMGLHTQWVSDQILLLPKQTARRGEAIKCLKSAFNRTLIGGNRPFIDVDSGDDCDNAVKWAVTQDWITLNAWGRLFKPKRHVEKLTATRSESGVTFELVVETEDRPEDCGVDGGNLTWDFDEETGTLTITGSGEMADYWDRYPWNLYPCPWSELRESIRRIVLPDGLTAIGHGAFQACTALTELSLPDTLESIGDAAFASCSALQELTLPDAVEIVGDSAFSACDSLQMVRFGKGIHWIGFKAFLNCPALRSVEMPEKLETSSSYPPQIVGRAFENCPSLERVTLSEGWKEIREYAFYNCPRLKSVTVPSSVVRIQKDAFGFWYDDNNALKPKTRVKDFVLCGERGSQAEDYAKAYGFLFCVPGGQPENLSKHVFSDVKKDDWFYPAVDWATSKLPPVTNGVDNTHFAPNKKCTRAEIVMFLWNAAENEGISDAAYYKVMYRFEDVFAGNLVQSGDWFYQAVFWAVWNGITDGVDETHFAPDQQCTRAEVVMFLWNAAGRPEVGGDVLDAPQDPDPVISTERSEWRNPFLTASETGDADFSTQASRNDTQANPFEDVSEDDWYYQAVLWAASIGVTAGTDATHFSPTKVCTRAEVVQFLYKMNEILHQTEGEA